MNLSKINYEIYKTIDLKISLSMTTKSRVERYASLYADKMLVETILIGIFYYNHMDIRY